MIVNNTLDRQFDVDTPDRVWVTDITYIKTYEGFSYLAVVIDLYSRRVVGWAMQSRQPTDLVLQALLPLIDRYAINCRAMDGRLATKANRKCPDTFGPRQPVYQFGMGVISKASRSGTQYEPSWQLS